METILYHKPKSWVWIHLNEKAVQVAVKSVEIKVAENGFITITYFLHNYPHPYRHLVGEKQAPNVYQTKADLIAAL